jgi:DNA-binding response OmpR family regulator
MKASLSVLVADPCRDHAETLAFLLSMGGHRVRQAHTARDAARLAEQEPPDAVFMEARLPDRDGFEFARSLTAGGVAWPRLVLVTGRVYRREQAAEAGFHDEFAKPADPTELLRLVGG